MLPNVDLYVTGSNAYLLSSELATLLTGRAFEINILPFSFAEYLEYTGKTSNPDRAFSEYMRIGGFPESVGFIESGENYAYEYIRTVFQNIYEMTYKNVTEFIMKPHTTKLSIS